MVLFTILAMVLMTCEGCKTPEAIIQQKIDTIIRYDTIYVNTPVDSSLLVLDGNGFGEDTKFIVKVDTVYRTVYVKGKPQTIKIAVTDTIVRYITNTIKQEKSFFDGVTLQGVMIFIGVIVAVAFIGNLFKK